MIYNKKNINILLVSLICSGTWFNYVVPQRNNALILKNRFAVLAGLDDEGSSSKIDLAKSSFDNKPINMGGKRRKHKKKQAAIMGDKNDLSNKWSFVPQNLGKIVEELKATLTGTALLGLLPIVAADDCKNTFLDVYGEILSILLAFSAGLWTGYGVMKYIQRRANEQGSGSTV